MKLKNISNPVLRDFYKRNFFPLKTFKVPSRTNFNSDLGEFEKHTVELWANGLWYCDCIGFNYKRNCQHIKVVKELLNKQNYGETKL